MHYLGSYSDAKYWVGKARYKTKGKPMGNYTNLVANEDGTIDLIDRPYPQRPRKVHARIHPNDDVELFCAYKHGDNRTKYILGNVFGVDIQRIGKAKYVVWDNRAFRSSERWNYPTQWLEYAKKMPLFKSGIRYNLRTKLVVDGQHEQRIDNAERSAVWKKLVIDAHRLWRVMAKVGAIKQQGEELLPKCATFSAAAEVHQNLMIDAHRLYEIIYYGLKPEHVQAIIATAWRSHWSFDQYLQTGCKASAPFIRAFEIVYKRHTDELRKLAGCYEVELVSTEPEPMKLAA